MFFKYHQLSFLIIISVLITACAPSSPANKEPAPKAVNLFAHDCIEHVITIDDSLGTIRNHACETMPLTDAIWQYVDGISEIDFKNCPADFSEAFENHRQAWVEMTSLTYYYPDLRGEMHDLFQQLEEGKDKETFVPLQKAIWDTWAAMEETLD